MSFLFEARLPSSSFAAAGGFRLEVECLGQTEEHDTLALAAAGALLCDQDGIMFDLLEGMHSTGSLVGKHGQMVISFDDLTSVSAALDMVERSVQLLAYVLERPAT